MFVAGRPTRLILEGDQAKAAEWVPFARKKLEELRLIGIPEKTYRAAEGVQVRVRLNEQDGIIHIKAEEDTLINGLCDLHLDFGVRGNYPWSVDKNIGVKDAVTHEAKGYGPHQAQKKLVKAFTSEADTFSMRQDYVQSRNIGLYQPSLNNSPFVKSPGMFTGEMRKVVQLVIGRNKPVLFEPSFYRSHGIYTDGANKRWVIEIGQRGIYAAKLPASYLSAGGIAQTKAKASSSTFDLPYLPTGTNPIPADDGELASALTKRTVLQLATSSDVAAFYALNPLFEACGWAFSASGHEAQNTAHGYNSSPNQGEDWYIFHRFRTRFTDAVTPGVGRHPTMEFFVDAEHDFLYGSRITHFKIPLGLNSGVISFDIFRNNFKPPPKDYDAPFYVFFSGEQARIARYRNGRPISTELNTDVVNPIAYSDHRPFNAPFTLESKNGITQLKFPEVIYLDTPPADTVEGFSGAYRLDEELETGGAIVSGEANSEQQPATNLNTTVTWNGLYTNSGSRSQDHLYSAVIPELDREGIYMYHQWFDQITSTSGKFTTITEVCPAGSPGSSSYTVWGFDTGCYIQRNINTGEIDPSPVVNWNIGFGNGYALSSLRAVYADGCPISAVDFRVDLSGSPLPLTVYDTNTPSPRVVSARETLVFHSSGGSVTLFSDRDRNGHLGGEWIDYIDGSFNVQYFHSVPEAFSGARYVSKTSGGLQTANYVTVGNVPLEYAPAADSPDPWKFFFGAPI